MRRMSAPSQNRTSGFILVELLVSIGIVALLASLLLSATKGTLESANKAKCLGNLKQLGVALREYATDNNNFGPYDAREAGNDSLAMLRAGPSLILYGQLLPYLISDTATYLTSTSRIPEVFICPSTESKMLAAYREPVGPGGLQYTRYFMNTDVSSNPNKKTNLLLMPAKTIAMMDDCYWWTTAPGYDENHSGKGFNCIRLDGSASWLSKKSTVNSTPWDFQALSKIGGS